MWSLVRQCRRERARGATAVEYALLVSGIALVLVLATFALGDDLSIRLTQMASVVQR
ncbi:Flp family type IVb pilin [Aeromicrobium sp. 636]|uniref:Flp family type IVb pilin n=1 Tax=Aeromicrobium senzhongii TaxID=2663859 RepID=A0A8I0EW94_9ACTN|nr:Flp family type IVb pilin [Aeromicrobium senzhongii]MCQ3998457.1 Flp family type IVb pilin [Aeromicrobium sp. 636]